MTIHQIAAPEARPSVDPTCHEPGAVVPALSSGRRRKREAPGKQRSRIVSDRFARRLATRMDGLLFVWGRERERETGETLLDGARIETEGLDLMCACGGR